MTMHTITLVHIRAKRRNKTTRPVPWLRRFVVGLAPHGLEFGLRLFQVGFVGDKVSVGNVSPVSINRQMLHNTHSLIDNRRHAILAAASAVI